jgi:hypothetical protein
MFLLHVFTRVRIIFSVIKAHVSSQNNLIYTIYAILLAALGPGIYSASNRNEYQKHKNNVSGE